jgi:hypothetical protein
LKTSFAKAPTAKSVAAPTETESTSALATQEEATSTLTVRGTPGQVNGEFTASDIVIPYLNLVAKTGELSNQFPAGAFVYNREVIIGDGKKPAQITVLRITKFYRQDLPFGTEETPKTFSTKRDVVAAGGHVGWSADAEEGSERYSEAMDCIVLLKSPTKGNAMFPFEFGGENYALAKWYITKSAYKSVGAKLFTDSQMALKDGIDTASYELTSQIKTAAVGSWYVPVVKLSQKHDAKFVEFVRGLLG